MKDLMMMLSALMPLEFLLVQLKAALSSYDESVLLNKSEEEIKKDLHVIQSVCAMILTKGRVGDSMDEVEKLRIEMDQVNHIQSAMKPKN